MNQEFITKYLNLQARMLEILLYESGINWKPESGVELEAIKEELRAMRPTVDAEHEKRESAKAGILVDMAVLSSSGETEFVIEAQKPGGLL